MAKMFYEKDCDLGKLDGKVIGIVGGERMCPPSGGEDGERRVCGHCFCMLHNHFLVTVAEPSGWRSSSS